MKFSNYLKAIDNVSLYPLISLVLFTAVFAAVLFYVFTQNKEKMDEQARIPLK